MKKEIIAYSDFSKMDVRVGKVLEASKIDKSKKLLLLKVDLGEDYGTVTILSGIGDVHNPEDMLNKKFMFVANLAPREMMGHTSYGMLMAANMDTQAGRISIGDEIPVGTEII